MPHETLNVLQVAGYLHLSVDEVVKLASRGHLPARKVKGVFQFTKSDIDHYVESRMHDLPHQRLEEIELGVSRHHGFDAKLFRLAEMIPPRGISVDLPARTRDSAIRCLVDLADAAELVYDHAAVVDEIRRREELCSTAMLPQVALPHPRHPLPYDIAESFVVVGRTAGGIPFGAPDGTLTRLFFLICCKDDRTHLHVLARISRMLDQATIAELLSTEDAAAARKALGRRESAVVERAADV